MRFLSVYSHESKDNVAPTPEMMAAMGKLIEEGMKAGWLLATEGVHAGGHTARVQSARGKITVTDGPFAEAKEFLAGYWIVDVENAEQAYAIAARASVAPGRGGKPLDLAIEVREVMSAPPV